MDFYGGGFNPIVRVSNLQRRFKQYSIEESSNPNITNSIGPMMTSEIQKTPIQPGKENISSGEYGYVPEVFQSGMIIIDPELRLLSALKSEQNLLSKLGFIIGPNDIVKLIKTNRGELKSAMVICLDAFNKVKKITYIDADSNSNNFQKGLNKILPSSISENMIDRIQLPNNLIKE